MISERCAAGRFGASAGGGNFAPLHDEDGRCRDLLPLPFEEREMRSGALSRHCSQRQLRRRHVTDEVNLTISSLNSMFGCGRGKTLRSLESKLMGASVAQKEALHHVKSSVLAMGPPPEDLSGPEALRQLRALGGYVEDQSAGALASYDPEGVSIPGDGWKPVDLGDLWGTDGGENVGDYVQRQLLPADEARSRLKSCGLVRPYSDPKLRDPKTYGEFVRRLLRANIVEIGLEPGSEEIGIFFVSKKNGRLRLIIDARKSNCHFADPAHVQLVTGDGLGNIEVEEGVDLMICSADLKDAFYHLALPEALRPLFTLPGVDGRHLRGLTVGGQLAKPGVRYYPRLAVVPMGWSWALYICQKVHERLAQQAGLVDSDRLVDRRPAPSAQAMHAQYVDNLVVIGHAKKKCSACTSVLSRCSRTAASRSTKRRSTSKAPQSWAGSSLGMGCLDRHVDEHGRHAWLSELYLPGGDLQLANLKKSLVTAPSSRLPGANLCRCSERFIGLFDATTRMTKRFPCRVLFEPSYKNGMVYCRSSTGGLGPSGRRQCTRLTRVNGDSESPHLTSNLKRQNL